MLTFSISYRGMVALGLAALTILALVRLWPIVLLLFVALILMGALLPAVDALARRGVRRGIAVAIVVTAILLVLIALIGVTLPAIVAQFRSVVTDFPAYTERLDRWLAGRGIEASLSERVESINWGRVLAGSANYGRAAAGVIFGLFTVFVLTVYLLADATRLGRLVYRVVPADRADDVQQLLHALRRIVGGYVRGQAITSGAIALFTAVLLAVLGVPNALAYGIIAGFFDIIPLVGAFIAIAPAVLAAFQVSGQTALIVLVAMVAYQQFEDRFLVPRVYGSTLNLPAIAVFLATLCGAQLLGIIGVMLALPAAAATRVLIEYWVQRRRSATSTSTLG